MAVSVQNDQSDPTAVQVQELISVSRDLVQRLAEVTAINSSGSVLGVVQGRPVPGAAEIAAKLPVPPQGRSLVEQSSAAAAWDPAMREVDEVCRELSAGDREVIGTFLSRVTAALRPAGAS